VVSVLYLLVRASIRAGRDSSRVPLHSPMRRTPQIKKEEEEGDICKQHDVGVVARGGKRKEEVHYSPCRRKAIQRGGEESCMRLPTDRTTKGGEERVRFLLDPFKKTDRGKEEEVKKKSPVVFERGDAGEEGGERDALIPRTRVL